ILVTHYRLVGEYIRRHYRGSRSEQPAHRRRGGTEAGGRFPSTCGSGRSSFSRQPYEQGSEDRNFLWANAPLSPNEKRDWEAGKSVPLAILNHVSAPTPLSCPQPECTDKTVMRKGLEVSCSCGRKGRRRDFLVAQRH